jgi:hypothetical protein
MAMRPIRQTDRAFGFTFAGVFAFIAILGWLLFGRLPHWALVTAVTFAVLAVMVPGVLMPLNRVWGWVAPKIAALNNAIVLGLVFYLFVTPVGLMMRLFRRDPMCRAMEPDSDSYWTPVKRQTNPETFQDQF